MNYGTQRVKRNPFTILIISLNQRQHQYRHRTNVLLFLTCFLTRKKNICGRGRVVGLVRLKKSLRIVNHPPCSEREEVAPPLLLHIYGR